MNLSGNSMDGAALRVREVFASQRAAFEADPYPLADRRREKIKALKRQISRYQDVLAEAMSKDFGFRAPAESKMLDLLGSMLEANHATAHLKRWMKPRRRATELLFLTNSLSVTYQPKGVVGVIVPWNFPIYLAVGPLIAALAAGNRVMIKMSEITPATNAELTRMLGEIFQEDEVAVVGAELADPNACTALPFNPIIFTGSPGIGKIVMRSASESLTPVTLELGGKSPALVLRDYPLADAAKRITHGKTANCEQICVSPDYALIPRQRVNDFFAEVKSNSQKMSGSDPGGNEHTWSVSDRHCARLNGLLSDAREKGATVISCSDYDVGRNARRMPLHVITNCTAEMRIMNEELFGPILPVVPYDTLEDAIGFINAGERPLAMYCFSHDAGERQALLRRTHSGGVTINDWAWHAINHDAPFGGVGHSGMGTYHGAEGFPELSHAKTVFKRHRFFPVGLFYPPYGNLAQRLSLKLFLGTADPSLKETTVSPSSRAHH